MVSTAPLRFTAGSKLKFASSMPSQSSSVASSNDVSAANQTNPTSTPPNSVWGNTGKNNQGRQDLRRQTLLMSTAKSQNAMPTLNGGGRVDSIQSGMHRMKISGLSTSSKQPYYDASNAPGASAMTTAPKAPVPPPSQATVQVPVNNNVAICSGYSRYDFQPGDLISIPYHETNTNASLLPTDPNLTFTCQGPVYSKRRLAIVLWVHHFHMFCVPMYTHSGQGLKNKKGDLVKEYVCVMNRGPNPGFENDGKYPPITVSSRKPMKPESSVHITGGFKVPCNGDVLKVGGLVGDSYVELVELWKGLAQNASGYTWTQ